MGKEVKIGQQDYSVLVFIPDPASTDGSGKTGLLAANLTVSGVRVEIDNDVTVTDYTVSLNDLVALTDAHNDWGIKEVSSTLAPGLYRLDIADAIFLTGAWQAVVYVMITTSAAAASPIEFTLVPESPYSGVTATSVPAVTLANGAHGGAGATITLQTPIAATVPDTQKVDVNTIKTQAITCGAGVTVLASVGTAGTAIAQSRDLTDAVLAGAIWNAATASYGSAGSYGLLIETDLDATISSRSTYAGGDTSGTTELLTRIPDATAGATGGLTICGSNAAATFASLTCTGALTVSDGLIVTASTAGREGASFTGNTTGAGLKATGGATGNGMTLSAGATSGHGLSTTAVGTSYNGINALGSATSGNGIKAIGGGAGHGIWANSGSGLTGQGICAISSASTAGNGIFSQGAGGGHGLGLVAGSTGNGIRVLTTAGDGILVTPTGGHALNLTGNGTSKHGLLVTGGTAGTSDGFSAVAGTGGVPIRGDITGNITGTITTATNLTNAPPDSTGVTSLMVDVGDASASTLGSIYAILGNAAATLTSRIPVALDGGNMASQVKGQDNIDFGALQKASITAAVPTAAACGTDAASKVLITPAQKIVTDASGQVAANVKKVNDVTLQGNGSTIPWGPA